MFAFNSFHHFSNVIIEENDGYEIDDVTTETETDLDENDALDEDDAFLQLILKIEEMSLDIFQMKFYMKENKSLTENEINEIKNKIKKIEDEKLRLLEKYKVGESLGKQEKC
jgi:hypothetical protein